MPPKPPPVATSVLNANRRRFLKVSGTLALAAPFALKSGWTFAADETPRVGGTLVVGQYQEPTVYDPNRQYSWETYRVDRHIYESLVGEDLSQPASQCRCAAANSSPGAKLGDQPRLHHLHLRATRKRALS